MIFDDTIKELHQRFDIFKQEDDVNKVQNLQIINEELLFLKREIEAKMEQSYVKALNMNVNIDHLAGQTSELQTEVNGLKNKDAGSIQRYRDVHELYNQQLIGNWLLVLVISYAGYISSTLIT
jgi:hypothetical protein|tara:strand:- start:493 stop:861 length:369 start_codon:yes stop_codon:yes gene_type:complete